MFEFLAFIIVILILVLGFRFLLIFIQKVNTNLRDVINQTSTKQNERLLPIEEMLGASNEQYSSLDEKLDSVFTVLDSIILNQKIATIQLEQIELETLKRELSAALDIRALMGETIRVHKETGILVSNEMIVAFQNREAEIFSLEEKIQNHEKGV